MTRILCILLFLAFAAAYGQQQERIAIMHTVDNIDSISVTDLGYLTNKLRDIASKILPQDRYGIMTQQSIVDRLGSQERAEKECREATCLADLGRKISADYISQARIGRFSGRLTIEVELYRVRGSTLIGAITGDSKDMDGLLAVLESKAPKLFEDMQRVLSAKPEKPALPPEPPLVPPVPPPEPTPPPPVPDSAFVLPVVPAVADSPAVPLIFDPFESPAQKECENKFNINELVFKIGNSFSSQLRDCAAALAKNMALAASPFPFGKKTEQKEPKAFMMECVIDGIKQKLPSGADEYIKPIEGFVQNLLNAASAAGGGLDVKMLSGAIGNMNVNDLINELKAKAANDDCAADEPYEPSVALEDKDEGEGSEEKKSKRRWSLGLRAGFNASHLYAEYDNGPYHGSGTYESLGSYQFGLVFDWAFSDWLHIQPGIVGIRKGAITTEKETTYYYDYEFTKSNDIVYLEIPLLLSLKFSVLRINAGPYFGINVYSSSSFVGDSYNDFGISTGFGFDIWRLYIGMFYDYGLTKAYSYSHNDGHLKAYNRTLGFNLGVNL